MFNNLKASRALKHCTNRFVVQRKPCKTTGLFPKWISVVSGPECRTRINAAKPEKVSRLLGRDGQRQNIARRYLQQKSSNESSQDNTVLLIGLGALGLVSVLTYKAGIFLPEVRPDEGTPKSETSGSNEDESIAVSEDSAEPAENLTTTHEDERKSTAGDSDANQENDEKQTDSELVVSKIDDDTIVIEAVPAAEQVSTAGQDESATFQENTDNETSGGSITSNNTAADVKADDNKVVQEEVTPSEPSSSNDTPKIEIKLPKIPESVPYLIIGAGTASHAACRAIRKNDPTAKILIVGDEEVLPYMRPPLSKELWFSEDEDTADTLYFKQWNGKQRSVFFEDDRFYTKPQLLPTKEEGGTAVLTGHKVTEVNAKEHIVKLKNGATIKYQKLLIATGGHPKAHPVFKDVDETLKTKVTLFRTVADYRKLDKLVANTDSIAIVGGGFLGSELACALAAKSKKSGIKVTQIFHEDGNMGKVLPKYLSEWTTKKVEKEGVNIKSNAEIRNASLVGDDVVLELSTNENVTAGHVVVCIGLEPNTDLAASAGLEVDPDFGGFRVNSELQARSDIWIAGDVSCFYDPKLGRRRVEHHDHAVVSGRLAGQNMAGAKNSYVHQSMFWSDLGPDVGYEAIGLVDNALDTVGVWAKATETDSPKAVVEATGESVRSASEQDAEIGEEVAPVANIETLYTSKDEEFGKGVVFYLKDKVVVGILLWNIFNKMPVARKILKDGKKQNDLKELAKLFNIHD